jgi:predicted homoserine dehydrogenase-like protein
MIYQQLFDRVREPDVVRTALIGCGNFGAAVFTQGRLIPRLELEVVCDVNVEAAKQAFRLAGVQEADIAVCDTAGQALWRWRPASG